MNIEEIERIALKYGGFSFKNFLKSEKASYSIIIHFTGKDSFNIIDGLNCELIKVLFKVNHVDGTSASYKRLDDKSPFPLTVDCFMFEESLLNDKDSELIELIVFHELCHALEKAKYYFVLKIEFSDNDRRIGKIIEEYANRPRQDEDHNENFGALLNHFFEKYDAKNRHILLSKSMIKNFGVDVSDILI